MVIVRVDVGILFYQFMCSCLQDCCRASSSWSVYQHGWLWFQRQHLQLPLLQLSDVSIGTSTDDWMIECWRCQAGWMVEVGIFWLFMDGFLLLYPARCVRDSKGRDNFYTLV
jgi:hypothetical protein